MNYSNQIAGYFTDDELHMIEKFIEKKDWKKATLARKAILEYIKKNSK